MEETVIGSKEDGVDKISEEVAEPDISVSSSHQLIEEDQKTNEVHDSKVVEASESEVFQVKEDPACVVNDFTNQVAVNISAKLPILMMILFSIFIVASIIIFYEVI